MSRLFEVPRLSRAFGPEQHTGICPSNRAFSDVQGVRKGWAVLGLHQVRGRQG
jgi:hypothetical protein